MFAALYGSRGEIVDISKDTKEIPQYVLDNPDNIRDFEVTLDIPGFIGDHKVKVFIWDSIQGMKPVVKPTIFPDSLIYNTPFVVVDRKLIGCNIGGEFHRIVGYENGGEIQINAIDDKILAEIREGDILLDGKPLHEKYKDHALKGKYQGYRECHITPDWLLVYYVRDDILTLTLTATGTHSDLF
jgi:mRNA interferase YafQ